MVRCVTVRDERYANAQAVLVLNSFYAAPLNGLAGCIAELEPPYSCANSHAPAV